MLTIIAAILAVINITEIALLDRVNASRRPLIWIIAIPATILGVLLCLIVLWTCCSFQHVRTSYADAPGMLQFLVSSCADLWPTVSKKIARLGVVLGILLPVILCQFWYLPFVALPHFRYINWVVSVENYGDGIKPPLIYVFMSFDNDKDPGITIDANCSRVDDYDVAQDLGCAKEPISMESDTFTLQGMSIRVTEPYMLSTVHEIYLTVQIDGMFLRSISNLKELRLTINISPGCYISHQLDHRQRTPNVLLARSELRRQEGPRNGNGRRLLLAYSGPLGQQFRLQGKCSSSHIRR